VNQEPVTLDFEVDRQSDINFIINDISFDLLTHDQFDVPSRNSQMIPKPFILNDAVIVKHKLNL